MRVITSKEIVRDTFGIQKGISLEVEEHAAFCYKITEGFFKGEYLLQSEVSTTEVDVVTHERREMTSKESWVYIYVPMLPEEAKEYAPLVVNPAWRIKIETRAMMKAPPIIFDYGVGNPMHGRVLHDDELTFPTEADDENAS